MPEAGPSAAAPPRRWDARWIWFREPPPWAGWYGQRPRPFDAFGYLRRSFVLDAVPASAPCRATADGRYILTVNGVVAGRGPVRSEPAFLTADSYDLAPLLREGENVLAVLARHYGGPVVWWKPAPALGDLGFGSFALELRLGTGDDAPVVGTDASWRVAPAPYDGPELPWPEGPPPIEILDGRLVPEGWDEPGFDDSSWAPAIELKAAGLGTLDSRPPCPPFPLLGPRPIPQLDERVVEPAAEPSAGTWDFGGIMRGHPMVALDADPGTVVELSCGEDLDPAGSPIVAPRAWSMRYTASGRAGEAIEAFEPVGFRYLRAVVREGRVRSVRVSARERTYPRPAGPFFACGDELLETLWTTGVRTLDLCSADAFIDCPGREQRAWLGDALVTSTVSLLTNPDTRLVRWNLRLHAQGARADGLLPMVAAGDMSARPETIPDQSLEWIVGLWRTWLHTGDDALADELLPVAERILGWFARYAGDDGLLADLPWWVFIDWAQLGRGTHIAAVDALHVLALDAFASLCEGRGRPGPAAAARDRAARAREGFERYWDPKRGVYVDASGARRVSQQTNAVAIAAACAPRERWDGMLAAVLDEERLVRTLTPGDPGANLGERMSRQWSDPPGFDDERNVVLAQPFFCHFLHEALALADRREDLLASIRRWETMLARGNGCFEEYWTAAPGLGSRAHVWAATPTPDLTTFVLGFRAASPGCTEIEVAPWLGSLPFARGAVPTPKGLVHIEAVAGGSASVDAPPGVSGVLSWRGARVPIRGGGRTTAAATPEAGGGDALR